MIRAKWAVMKQVRLVQQESTSFKSLSSMLEGFSDRRCSFKSTSRSRVASNTAESLPGIGGRAGDQRTLYASFIHSFAVIYIFFLSGSTVCFVLASLSYPEAIQLMFGRSAAEMEEVTWEYLDLLVGSEADRDDDGLSMILKMTRFDDLGLSQLLFS